MAQVSRTTVHINPSYRMPTDYIILQQYSHIISPSNQLICNEKHAFWSKMIKLIMEDLHDWFLRWVKMQDKIIRWYRFSFLVIIKRPTSVTTISALKKSHHWAVYKESNLDLKINTTCLPMLKNSTKISSTTKTHKQQ